MITRIKNYAKKFFSSNLLWGSALCLVTLFFYFTATGLETAELKFYDFRARMSAASSAKNEIAVIEINDDSISKIGRWPWPRSKVADMLLWLSSSTARPSVIGLDILFSEPEKNPGIELGDYLKTRYRALVAEKKIKETGKTSGFLKIIDEARASLDNDIKLSSAVAAAGNVVLPLLIKTGEAELKPEPEPQWLKKFAPAIAHPETSSDIQNAEAARITVPLEVLCSSAAGVGHVNVFADSDGTVRREYPFIPYNRSFYPSFASEIVRVRLKLAPQEVTLSPGSEAVFGRSRIPLDQASSVLVAFNKSRTSFNHYSFYDVINGKIVPEAFKDKIVLIGLTAQGMGTPYVTPVESNLQAVEFTANVIDDILEGRFISRPGWAFQVELGLIFFTGLFVIFLLPRLKAGVGAGLTALMLCSLAGAGIFLFTSKSIWLKTLYPAFLLITGYLFIVGKRFFSTEKNPDKKHQTAGDMVEDIKTILRKNPLSPDVPETPLSQPRTAQSRIPPASGPGPGGPAKAGQPVVVTAPSGAPKTAETAGGNKGIGKPNGVVPAPGNRPIQPAPAIQTVKPQPQISPLAPLELTRKVKPPVALTPAPQPKTEPAAPPYAAQKSSKPATAAARRHGDFEKTLPLIYPEKEKT